MSERASERAELPGYIDSGSRSAVPGRVRRGVRKAATAAKRPVSARVLSCPPDAVCGMCGCWVAADWLRVGVWRRLIRDPFTRVSSRLRSVRAERAWILIEFITFTPGPKSEVSSMTCMCT